ETHPKRGDAVVPGEALAIMRIAVLEPPVEHRTEVALEPDTQAVSIMVGTLRKVRLDRAVGLDLVVGVQPGVRITAERIDLGAAAQRRADAQHGRNVAPRFYLRSGNDHQARARDAPLAMRRSRAVVDAAFDPDEQRAEMHVIAGGDPIEDAGARNACRRN